jgi:hypothetical protein
MTMNRISGRTWLTSVLGIVVLLAPALVVADAPRAQRTRPGYQRGEARRPQAKRTESTPLPEPLRLEVQEVATRPPRSAAPDAVRREAARAAVWAANHTVDKFGFVEYFRVGFHTGMRVALADERLGKWDFREGLRLGRRDPQARAVGAAAGSAAAADAARAAAREKVEQQFLDLDREPRFAPLAASPAFTPATQWATTPTLREIFVVIPAPRQTVDLGRYDAWKLYECDSHTVFFDNSWSDWRRAFDQWLSNPMRSRVYRRLTTEIERERFKRLFRVELRRQVARQLERKLLPAHDRGFDAGWDYGARLNYEWNFRLGYSEGFDRAAGQAAGAAFAATYAPAFRREYRVAFDDWSSSVRPEILAVSIADGNDDGIYQPGESLLVGYELANYGGASGAVELELHGPHLTGSATRHVLLPRRSVLRSDRALRAAIVAATPARTRSAVTLALGQHAERVDLLVSYPLEFAGRAEPLRIDALDGTATVLVRVANRSRKVVPATLALERLDDPTRPELRELGPIGPGDTISTSFRLSGIRPLDLIGGRLALRFDVQNGTTLHDGLGYRFPVLAHDLGNDDLLRYMVVLSRDPGADRREIAAARNLMLSRLRVDWKAAVRRRGNPYKKDFKLRRGDTALGALVATYVAEQHGMTRPEVFAGLGGEIELLALELPGIHPFLRKYVKRLARRMDRT